MNNRDAIQMAQRAVEEITMLRRAVSALEPKAEAYDLIHKIIGLIPGPSQGAGEDLVWRLNRQIEELKAKGEDA